MRSLAHIERVEWKRPIPGKDRIELIGVLGWTVIAKKDEFQEGDKVIYVEIDSILPEREEFEFLRDKKFRIKTMKMAGVLSQGIVFPLSILDADPEKLEIGQDVTKELSITKYEPEIELPAEQTSKESDISPVLKWMLRTNLLRWLARIIMRKQAKKIALLKQWPSFVSKTDEPRIQNMPWVLNDKLPFIVTEKVDGQSGTFFLKKKSGLAGKLGQFEFGVCSRNLRLPNPDNSSYWSIARRYDLEVVLRNILHDRYPDAEYIAIQGEVVGPGIQKNKYQLTAYDMYAFNLILPFGKVDSIRARSILASYGVPFVPILDTEYYLPDTVDEMLAYATGESKLAETMREGVVIRNYEKNLSFKAVSNEFLLKWKE